MNHRSQRGITLIGFLMVLILAGFFVFLGMRLVPTYVEYYSVARDMDGLAAEPGITTMGPEKIRDLLFRRFYVSYVDSVKPQHVKLTQAGDGYDLRITYEVRKELIYNLDYVAKFDRTVELRRGGAL